MNGKFNTISFCRDDYKNMKKFRMPGEEILIDEDLMLNDIRDFVRIAMKNGYQMRIWDDGLTVSIEYNYFDESISGVSLEWLDENDAVILDDGRETTDEQ